MFTVSRPLTIPISVLALSTVAFLAASTMVFVLDIVSIIQETIVFRYEFGTSHILRIIFVLISCYELSS